MPLRIDSHPEILGTPTQTRFDWPDEPACTAAATRLAGLWQGDAPVGTVALHGPLGAGKTTFVRALMQALGWPGRIKSPTYALVEPYAVPLPGGSILAVAHCDFYRFEDEAEWEDAGLRDLFGAASLRLVEWPERAAGRLGPIDLALHLEPVPDAPNARRVLGQASSPAGAGWLRALQGAAR